MTNPIYSGAINSTGAPVLAIPVQTIPVTTGFLWNPTGSGAGQWSLDGGTNWVDFEAGPFSMPMPPGKYDKGVKVQGAAVVGVKMMFW